MDIAQLIVTAIVGLGAGLLAALATPFAQRAAESRRLREERRRQIVDDGRALISEWHQTRPGSLNRDWLNDARFDRLRPHLTESTQQMLRDRTIIVTGGDQDDASTAYTRAVSNDLDRIEREWKLI